MAIILLIALLGGILIVLLRRRFSRKQKDQELLNDFLHEISSSFHEYKWTQQKASSVYDKLSQTEVCVQKLKEDTDASFKFFILNIHSLPKGFQGCSTDTGTILFISAVYKHLKDSQKNIGHMSYKSRKEDMKLISTCFYNKLEDLIKMENQYGLPFK